MDMIYFVFFSFVAAVKEEWEKRVEQMEASLLMQASNSRTTLQLVKEQLTNEGQARLEALENEYQRKLGNVFFISTLNFICNNYYYSFMISKIYIESNHSNPT